MAELVWKTFNNRLHVSFDEKNERFYCVEHLRPFYMFLLNQLRTSINANALNACSELNIGRRRSLLNIRRALRFIGERKLPLHVTSIKPCSKPSKSGRFFVIG